MSVQNALDFSSAILTNPALMSEVSAIIADRSLAESAADVAALGKKHGFDFTPAEAAVAHQQLLESQELSLEQLEQVAGGAVGGGGTAVSVPPTAPGPTSGGNNSGGYQETYLTTATSQAMGAMIPGGGIVGAGVGAGINSALNGASAGQATADGAMAANDSLNSAKSAASSW